MRSHRVIAVVGPTAIGKSAVAQHIALTLGGEVVSADAMQVYRGMDIGTAKTPPGQRLVQHHCLDLIDPGQPYSAALYQRDARSAIDDVHGRGATPVVAGGTGLYVRAALDEMDFPTGDVATPQRAALEARARDEGGEALHAELSRLDPDSAALIHPNNVRRTIRALEMLAEGTSYAAQASGFTTRVSHYPGTVYVGLTAERGWLYDRIDARVETMVADGLLDEVSDLLKAGFRDALTAAQAIGYKEFVPVLEGTVPLDAAVATVKQATRRYAKRQLTWFRADERVRWIDATDLSSTQAASAALGLLESSEP